jgi:hypothetical protein
MKWRRGRSIERGDQAMLRSMSQFLVRPSTENDLSAIVRIYGHYVLHSSATF